METITLSIGEHRGEERLFADFPYDRKLISAIKEIPGARWSQTKKKWHFNGECCDYGHNNALDIIMSLLIDEGISSLGHRNICLSSYSKIGVAIQPHKLYGYNAVMDFYY